MNKYGRVSKLVLFLILVGSGAYIIDVFAGNVKTSLVTWMVVVTATGLNLLVVKLREGRVDFRQNSALVSSFLAQLAVLGSVLITGSIVEVTVLHLVMFLFSFLGFVVFLTQRSKAVLAAIIINLSIVVGFIPLWYELVQGRAVESLVSWSIMVLAAFLSLYPTIMEKNYLAMVFPARNLFTRMTVVLLSLWNMYF